MTPKPGRDAKKRTRRIHASSFADQAVIAIENTHNGKHLLGLINAVLDIAKIDSGQFSLNLVEYALESVVETVRAATELLAQNKKLALTTEVAKSPPIDLGDEQRLTQVLLNLVGIAIKFTDSGEVHITAKAVNGHFKLSVADTEPGIPAEHQTRIFDQFHQIDGRAALVSGSRSPSRLWRCMAVASGWSPRWVRGPPSRWSFPRALNLQRPRHE